MNPSGRPLHHRLHGHLQRRVALPGWNLGVWLYLALAAWTTLHADHARLRRVAAAQAERAGTVLTLVILASPVSLLGTVAGAWLLLPTIFALTRASAHHRPDHGAGLHFPGAGDDFRPDDGDLLHFSFTIAVAAQTADVSVTTPALGARWCCSRCSRSPSTPRSWPARSTWPPACSEPVGAGPGDGRFRAAGQRAVMTTPPTGLGHRRAFTDALKAERARARGARRP
jgi:hypothetical protein